MVTRGQGERALVMATSGHKKGKPDWLLLGAVLLLLSIGIIMVYSASQYSASYEPYNDTYYFLKKQLVNALVGAVALIFAYKIDFRAYKKFSYPLFVCLIGVLGFMVISTQIGVVGGAQRWLEVGQRSIQPSEFAKVILPMTMAKWISDHRDEVRSFQMGFLPCIGMTCLVCGLIFGQTDLSSAMVVGGTGFVVMFCAGIRPKYLLGTIGAGVAACTLAIILEPYRLERVYAWFNPWAYEMDEGYQTVQSLMALGSGGLTGVGLGSGGSKWFYLPERHTDFIFSVLGEEMGFLGAVLVVLLIFFIIWRGMRIAVKIRNLYASLLAMGVISSLALQSLLNLGVVTGLLPVTGVTLPFVSYGGTSLLVSMGMIGILLNISRFVDG